MFLLNSVASVKSTANRRWCNSLAGKMYRVVDDRQRFRLGVAKRKLAPPRQEAVTAAFDHEDATCVHARALRTHGIACWGWGWEWDVVVPGAGQQ
jgi:hypothetical protein